MSYTYEYARPGLTADSVVFAREDEVLKVLLIKRGRYPFEGSWAFPGGFVEEGESVEAAAERELAEETGLTGVSLEQLHVFSDPARDPRGHVISLVFYGLVNLSDHAARAADDAAEARWFPVDDVPSLAFDHDEILAMAVERAQKLIA